MRRIERKLGERGYARALKLQELIAQLSDPSQPFTASLDLRLVGIEHVAETFGVSDREARATLHIFAKAGLIEQEALKRGVVTVPGMMRALDEWTSRRIPKQKIPTMAKTREELPSTSRAAPARSDLDKTTPEGDKSDGCAVAVSAQSADASSPIPEIMNTLGPSELKGLETTLRRSVNDRRLPNPYRSVCRERLFQVEKRIREVS